MFELVGTWKIIGPSACHCIKLLGEYGRRLVYPLEMGEVATSRKGCVNALFCFESRALSTQTQGTVHLPTYIFPHITIHCPSSLFLLESPEVLSRWAC